MPNNKRGNTQNNVQRRINVPQKSVTQSSNKRVRNDNNHTSSSDFLPGVVAGAVLGTAIAHNHNNNNTETRVIHHNVSVDDITKCTHFINYVNCLKDGGVNCGDANNILTLCLQK